MAKLHTLKPRVNSAPKRVTSQRSAEKRTTGRALQNVRIKMWTQNPHCARCGRITAYPYGFEIDHTIPLHKGGADDESNRQLLCIDEPGREGCHTIKTREDMGFKQKQTIGQDGWPVDK